MTDLDIAVDPKASLNVVEAVSQYRKESEESDRKYRLKQNDVNRRAFMNIQDWSHKIEGQSKEFLPKTSSTVEQFSAFIKRALVQFGDWFSITAPKDSPLSESAIRKLINCFFENLPDDQGTTTLALKVADATKVGLLESLMIFKVHGQKIKRRVFKTENGESLLTDEISPWKLKIDLIRPEDYYPDPTGRGLYEIHRVERDLHEVRQMAEEGVYDEAVVDLIENDFKEEKRKAIERNPDDDRAKPGFRRRVVLDEFLGTLLDEDGNIAQENVLCTVANEKYLIRKPEPNPYWHQESHFVVIPIIRVPFTVWHKALYDQVVPLNFAINELFNLILDGGISSVWGIKQLRLNMLEDPSQVTGGIPQGKTLAVREDMPEGMKVLETISEGKVPQDAMATFNLVDREYNVSALTNDLKQGLLPPKEVKATEIIAVDQGQAVVLDSITTDIEQGLTQLIRKAWLTILQNADDLLNLDVKEALTSREMLALARMSEAERFNLFSTCGFKAHGLSATLAKARDFQKLMALIQVASQSQFLLPAFLRKISGDKLLTRLFKLLNINPDDIGRDENDMKTLPEDMAFAQQMTQGGGGVTGEPGVPSEINQEAKPSQV